MRFGVDGAGELYRTWSERRLDESCNAIYCSRLYTRQVDSIASFGSTTLLWITSHIHVCMIRCVSG